MSVIAATIALICAGTDQRWAADTTDAAAASSRPFRRVYEIDLERRTYRGGGSIVMAAALGEQPIARVTARTITLSDGVAPELGLTTTTRIDRRSGAFRSISIGDDLTVVQIGRCTALQQPAERTPPGK